jgi:hypothetical protein
MIKLKNVKFDSYERSYQGLSLPTILHQSIYNLAGKYLLTFVYYFLFVFTEIELLATSFQFSYLGEKKRENVTPIIVTLQFCRNLISGHLNKFHINIRETHRNFKSVRHLYIL